MIIKGTSLMRDETGQVILVLILVMTVALAIGISVIQRSLSDISTSSKVEQSSRAFSAAEAGIEKTLVTGNTAPITLQNNAQAQATDTGLIPAIAPNGIQQSPLEYPPLSKEEVAQVWLANLDSPTNPPAGVYKQSSLDVYWGNSSTDRAALELTLVYYDSTVNQYKSQKFLLDQVARSPNNNFDTSANCAGGVIPPASSTSYQCKKTISLPAAPASLMLLRARLLYNTSSQPFAVQPPSTATCGVDCSLPPQARIIVATGTAGITRRKVQLFQINKVVPPYFDYAIFSAGAINK